MDEMGFDNLGFVSEAIRWGLFGVISLFCTPIVVKFGPKNSFVLMAVLRMLWELSYCVPAIQYEMVQSGQDVS